MGAPSDLWAGHKGDQRADDNTSATHDVGRKLIAQRLSTPCRHYDKGVLPGQNGSDNLFLIREERVKAEQVLENASDRVSCLRLNVRFYCLLNHAFIPFWLH